MKGRGELCLCSCASKRETVWEALRLLIPSSRKGWVLLFLLAAALLAVASLAQFRVVGEGKGAMLLRESFWWGAFAGLRNRLVTSNDKV